jgi:hypothetical protein
MAEVSELLTIISADNKKFIAAMNQASNKAAGFAKDISKLGKVISGAFALSAASQGIKNLYNQIDDLITVANKLDIGVGQFQALSYAADQSDVSVGTLEAGLKRLRTSVAQAQGGNKKLIESFASIGLSVSDLNQPIDELYLKISDAMKGKGSQGQVGIVNAFFGGKAGQEQLLLMRNNIRGLVEEARAVGKVMNESDVEAFSKLDETVNKASFSLKTSLMQAFVAVEPAITAVAKLITHTLKQLGDFVSAAGDLLRISQNISGIVADKLTGNDYDPNAAAPFDPSATVTNFKRRRQESLLAAPIVSSGLGGVGGSIPEIPTLSSSLKELSNSALAAATNLAQVGQDQKLKDLFGGGGTSGKDYLSSILKPIPEATDKTFTELANKLRDIAISGGNTRGVPFQSGLATMESIARSYGGDPTKESNSGMLNAIQAIKEAAGMMNKEKTVTVVVKVKDSEFISAVVESDKLEGRVQQGADKAVKAAIQSAARQSRGT